MEYVGRIFRWSAFRNKQVVQRQNLSEELMAIRRLCEYFGNPQKDVKVIHVAGTNGKGSVSLKVAKALQEMGYKTGLFTSPHINSFRERVQVN